MAKAISHGTVGGPIIGDARMMPGTFLIDASGKVAFTYYSKDISDHPDVEVILEAAAKIKK